jgi:hypothetical protein
MLAVVKAAVELPGEVNPTLEPAVVTVPVASASLV